MQTPEQESGPRRGRSTLIQLGLPHAEARELRTLARERGYISVQELLRELVRGVLREDRMP